MADEDEGSRSKQPSVEERLALAGMLERGAEREDVVARLTAQGWPREEAERVALELDDEVQERLGRGHAGARATKPRGSPFRGIFNIVIGVVFVAGGASGNLVLKGTDSGGAIAVVGVALIGFGIWRMRQR